MFALIGVIQAQLLAITFLSWLSFTWFGLAAASAIWLGSFLSLNLIDIACNRIFNRVNNYDFRVEFWLRLALQLIFTAGVIWLCQTFVPSAFAASWLNFPVPYLASLAVSTALIGFSSFFMLWSGILPVTFSDLNSYFYRYG